MSLLLKHPLIAHHPDQLTVKWAQQIVNQYDKRTNVKQVEIISVDIGTTTRIRLQVSHNGPNSLPKQWFIKIPSLSWRARAITALPRLLHTETRFYNELADSTPTTKPKVLAANSFFARGSTLVLHNISEQGAIPGLPSDTLTIEQAQQMIELLASLHARFWNKNHNNAKYNWLAGPVRKLEDHLGTALAVPLMKRGLNKAGNLVPTVLHTPAIQYARQRRRAMRFLAQGTQTIVHHDCHPGNLFWHNNKPGLLDWQMVRMGEGIGDIAYFLATSLEPATRKANEIQLVNHYTETLAKKGIENIHSEHILQRYRAHLVYPLEAMLVTLAVGDMMDLEANHLLIKRAAAAVKDNNTFAELTL